MPTLRDDSPTTPRHPIRVVAERTGITAATLRAWERRHRAIAPRRSLGAQRLYSDADIERLRLIGQLAAVGYPLADLARHATTTLARMLKESAPDAAPSMAETEPTRSFNVEAALSRLMQDTRDLDAPSLRGTLTRAVFELGPLPALDAVFSPFLRAVGDAWACQAIGMAHEHLASAAVRDVLGWLLQNATHDRNAPVLIATTPAGELHEFGAMMAAVVGAVAGWRVVYLGPNVPADELVRVVKESRARALLTSIASREGGHAELRDEMLRLRDGAGPRLPIIVGGAATDEHRLTLRKAHIDLVESRVELRAALDALWKQPA